MTPRPRLAWALFPLAALALVEACAWIRPYPFTSGDGLLRFLPLIKAHTDSLLSGAPLRMLWSVGAGWSPVQSGEMGVAYPPYHLANLLARALGRPLALLEVSAWMHLAAAGLVAWHLLPARIEGAERWLLGLLCVAMPAPLILGLNWASYLAGYPWFLALVLLAARPCARPGRRTAALMACAAGFWAATHVQMFLLGAGLLLLALLAEIPGRRDGPGLKSLLIALLPFAVPLAYVKMLSLHASLGWQRAWASRDLLVQGAQSLKVALAGLAVGNLAPVRGFQVLEDVPWVGVGVFFAPWLLAAVLLAFRDRRWLAAAFWTLVLLLLGARSAPFLTRLAVGPLAGFRWTWKLMLLVGPLGLAALLATPAWQALAPRWRQGLAALALVLSVAVGLRGVPFVLSRGAAELGPLGAEAMVRDTREVLARCGVAEGTRIGLVDVRGDQPFPVALAVLPGNGALLCGLESAHLFEPLDDAMASVERYGLTSQAFISPAFLRRPDADAWLARIGIQALVAADPLEGADVRSATDRLGRRIWVRPVQGALPWTYPWALGPRRLVRLPGGRLRTAEPGDPRPRLINSRTVDWRREADGTWTGTPEAIPPAWWAAGLGVLALCLAYTWLLDRPRILGGALSPPAAPAPGSASA